LSLKDLEKIAHNNVNPTIISIKNGKKKPPVVENLCFTKNPCLIASVGGLNIFHAVPLALSVKPQITSPAIIAPMIWAIIFAKQ
jgi:hypothetical protein